MERIGHQRDILGESPVWDDGAQALFWVDIRSPALRRFDDASGQVETRPMPGLAEPHWAGTVGHAGRVPAAAVP